MIAQKLEQLNFLLAEKNRFRPWKTTWRSVRVPHRSGKNYIETIPKSV